MTQPECRLKQEHFSEERQRVLRNAVLAYRPAKRVGSRTENALLAKLTERIRQIERPAATVHGVLPVGITSIDRALPGGGLARGALHEILGAGGDEEDGALAAVFAAYILGRLTRTADGIALWCLPRPDLYGPGLAAHGLDPARVVLVRAPRDAEILWAMEEGLHAPGIVAVVGEVGTLPAVASRRLQLAAEHSGATAFLLRRWRVPGGRLDDGLGGAPKKALRRALPQCQIVIPQRQLRLDQPRGIRHQARRHLQEGGSDCDRVGHSDAVPGGLPLEKFGDEFPALLSNFGYLPRQLEGAGKSIPGLAITG